MKNRSKQFIWAILAVIIACIACLIHGQYSRHETPEAETATSRAVQQKSGTTPAPVPDKQKAAVVSQSGAKSGQHQATAAGSKYANMDVLEQSAVLTEIGKRDLTAIFHVMLDAGRVENDSLKQLHVKSVFSEALREKTPSAEFLTKLRAFIANTDNALFERGLVIGALEAAATPQTVEILVEVATTSTDPPMRTDACGGLAIVGNRTAAGDKVAPILEKVWRETDDDDLLFSVALSMVRIGKPGSVEALLSAANSNGAQGEKRRGIATGALGELIAPGGVLPLVAVLEGNPVGSPANTLAFRTLAQIVGEDAPQAMMKWLQTADAKAAPMAKEWIENASIGHEIKAAEAALNPSVPFRSEANRKALRAGLNAYHANHRVGR